MVNGKKQTQKRKYRKRNTKFGGEMFVITPLLCTCTVNSGLMPHRVQNFHLKPNVGTLQGVFLRQSATERGFFPSRGLITILKVNHDSSVIPRFNCAAGAGIFHGNLNHLEGTLPPQHIEPSSGATTTKSGQDLG